MGEFEGRVAVVTGGTGALGGRIVRSHAGRSGGSGRTGRFRTSDRTGQRGHRRRIAHRLRFAGQVIVQVERF